MRSLKNYDYTSLREAHWIIGEIAKGKIEKELVPFFQAYNRVLAEDLISHVDISIFSISILTTPCQGRRHVPSILRFNRLQAAPWYKRVVPAEFVETRRAPLFSNKCSF